MTVQGPLVHSQFLFRQITERVSHIPEETQKAFVQIDRFDIGVVAGMSFGAFFTHEDMLTGKGLGPVRE